MKLKTTAKLSELTLAALLTLLGIGLLAWPETVAQGIRQGLDSCGTILIPSLFPFMTLCCLLNRTGAARILSLPLSPLTTRVYKLPEEAGVTILLSLLGGYPAGAKMISGLLTQKIINKAQAERMLCFCVCASPSFVISAVGAGMLGNSRVGFALFLSQACAALLLGGAISLRAPKPLPARRIATPAFGAAGCFVSAVADASSSMLGMCALAVLFSGLTALISRVGAPEFLADMLSVDRELTRAAAAGFMEVSGGCLAAARIGGKYAVELISIFCSFGGMSVIFQVLSRFEEECPRMWRVLAGRLAHTLLSLGLMRLLYGRLCADAVEAAAYSPPVFRADAKTWFMSICLICMCAIVVGRTGRWERRREGIRSAPR